MASRERLLGQVEQMVLLVVLRLGEAYGVQIIQEMNRCTGRRIPRGSLYITLDRLSAKGLLDSHRGEATPVRGGRAKRYFRVTPQGLLALSESRRALLALWNGLESQLEKV